LALDCTTKGLADVRFFFFRISRVNLPAYDRLPVTKMDNRVAEHTTKAAESSDGNASKQTEPGLAK
jgi:hypothetical protein